MAGRLAEAEADRRKVRHLMARDGLCSVMNDTKWRELCMTFYGMRPLPQFRIRDLLAPPGYVSPWDGEWYYHPYPYLTIEWMDVRPREGTGLQHIIEVLRRTGTVLEAGEASVRVFGYTRPGRPLAGEATEA